MRWLDLDEDFKESYGKGQRVEGEDFMDWFGCRVWYPCHRFVKAAKYDVF